VNDTVTSRRRLEPHKSSRYLNITAPKVANPDYRPGADPVKAFSRYDFQRFPPRATAILGFRREMSSGSIPGLIASRRDASSS